MIDRQVRKTKILVAAIIGIAFLFVNDSHAKTTITQTSDFNYEIKVQIVFDFKDSQAKNEADNLLARWQEGMGEVWNNNYGANEFGACACHVDYVFDLVKMESGKSCADYSDYHCIAIVDSDKNHRGNIADVNFNIPNSNKNSIGEWTIKTTGKIAAHEVGHLMGLEDEYHYELNSDGSRKWVNDNHKEVGPQSIMAQTWGKAVAFSEQTSKIMSKANFLSPEPPNCPEVQNNEFKISIVKEVKVPEIINFYLSSGRKISSKRFRSEELVGALIKGETDPAVYYVDGDGVLRWVENEAVAKKLFGENWEEKITWFNDALIYTYKFGEPIN